MKRRSILVLAAIAVVAAMLFSLFFPYQRMPELFIPDEGIKLEGWVKAAESSAEVKKIGDFDVVGSGHCGDDTGLLMLRSGEKYYLVFLDVNSKKVTEVREQQISWKTWEDIMREYPGLEDAKGIFRCAISTSPGDDVFYSIVALTPEKNYFVVMDKNYNITDVDPIEPEAWLSMTKNKEEVKEKIEGGKQKLLLYNATPWDGKNKILLVIESGNKQYSFSIEPDESIKYILEQEINQSDYPNMDPLEIAKSNEKIKSLIYGKEYAFSTPSYITLSLPESYAKENDTGSMGWGLAVLKGNYENFSLIKPNVDYAVTALNVEGRCYRVMVAEEQVDSVTSLEEEWFSQIKGEKLDFKEGRLIGSCRANIGAEPMAIIFIESEGNVYTVFLNIQSGVRWVEKIK
jgi:hypothetical protein